MAIFGEEFNESTLAAFKAIRTPSPQDEIEKIRDALNDEKKPIFDVALAGKNIFVTGEGGTGKSFLIQSIISAMRKQRDIDRKYSGAIIVAAPTGRAALNVNGITINRLLSIGCDLAFTKNRKNHTIKAAKLKKCRTVIIDEVSMIRVDVLDALFLAIKKVNDERAAEPDKRKRKNPISVQFYGDFHQLSPVYGKNAAGEDNLEIVKKFYMDKYGLDIGKGFAFEARYWDDFGFDGNYYMLQECMRNSHKRQQSILRCLRKGCNYWNVLEEFNMTCSQELYDEAVSIYPYVRDAAKKNREELAKIDAPLVSFPPIFEGQVSDELKAETPTLDIKIGCQVVMTSNAYDTAPWIVKPEYTKVGTKDLFVNGTVCTVWDIDKDDENPENDVIWLETEHRDPVKSWNITFGIKRQAQPIIEIYNGYPKPVGYAKVFAASLGYACTVHASQGMSLERINICNIGSGDFADGLGYVAVSRCTSFEGIGLDGWLLPGDVRVSRRVIDWEREKFGEKADVDFNIGPMTDEYGTVGVDGYQGFGCFAWPDNDDDYFELAELQENLELIGEPEDSSGQEEVRGQENILSKFLIIDEEN